MTSTVQGVRIPDSKLAREITEPKVILIPARTPHPIAIGTNAST